MLKIHLIIIYNNSTLVENFKCTLYYASVGIFFSDSDFSQIDFPLILTLEKPKAREILFSLSVLVVKYFMKLYSIASADDSIDLGVLLDVFFTLPMIPSLLCEGRWEEGIGFYKLMSIAILRYNL